MPEASYLALYRTGTLGHRIEAAWSMLARCELCRSALAKESALASRTSAAIVEKELPASRGLASEIFARTTRKVEPQRVMTPWRWAALSTAFATAAAALVFTTIQKEPGAPPEEVIALADVDMELIENLDILENLEMLELLGALEEMDDE